MMKSRLFIYKLNNNKTIHYQIEFYSQEYLIRSKLNYDYQT